MRLFVGLLSLVGFVVAKNEFYEGHSLYEVSVKSLEQVELVNDIWQNLNLDLWSYAVPGRAGQILVSKEKKQVFENILKVNGIEYKVNVGNIKSLIDEEDQKLEKASKKPYNASRSAIEGLSFDRVYTYEEVDEYIEALAEAYPETVTLVNGGNSVEGRPIKYLKISTTNFENQSKPIVFIESLLHAREWITLPVSLYAIHRLVIDVTEQDLLQNVDWIILPIANPDGYAHSHTNNGRFWRKNRRRGFIAGDVCMGVDLNRNFDVLWGTQSSNNVCTETFHGRSAFSEPETSVVRDIFEEYSSRIELFLDVHSFGSLILYGYGTGQLPPNALTLNLVGVIMAQAIDANKLPFNPNYVVGNSALVLYGSSGSAQDYGQAAGATFSYTLELPAYRGASGLNGFLLDPELIEQFGFETWEGIKQAARFVASSSMRNIKPRIR